MTVLAVERDPVALTFTIVSEFDAPAERVWQVWADPRQLERWWGTAHLSRHRRRPRPNPRRLGHLLHDRTGRREVPRDILATPASPAGERDVS
jgi:uncharacterized protein YndB with AHSA1/START domain